MKSLFKVISRTAVEKQTKDIFLNIAEKNELAVIELYETGKYFTNTLSLMPETLEINPYDTL